MKGIARQQQILSMISKCLKEYDSNLRNKNLMFILENKDKIIKKEEAYFPKSSFYHLTGIIITDKEGNKLNSYSFYRKIRDNIIKFNKYIIKEKDKTTDLKLQVLPQLMKIDKIANMTGEFFNYGMFLQTDIIIGNINVCMGFVKDKKLNTYVPNTALKKDIRDITNNRNRIIAILKKQKTESLYSNITYLKQNYEIQDVLYNIDIIKSIDIDNLYSNNKLIAKKIHKFVYEQYRINKKFQSLSNF